MQNGFTFFMEQIHEAAAAGYKIVSVESQLTSDGTFVYGMNSTGSVIACAAIEAPGATLSEVEEAGEICAAVAVAGGMVKAN